MPQRFAEMLELVVADGEAAGIVIRDLVSGTQESVPLKRVVEEVKKRLK